MNRRDADVIIAGNYYALDEAAPILSIISQIALWPSLIICFPPLDFNPSEAAGVIYIALRPFFPSIITNPSGSQQRSFSQL